MRRVASWLGLLVSLLLLSSSAFAARKKPLEVLIIQSEDAVQQAQALTTALKRAVSRSEAYAPADGDYSLEVMTLALGCAEPPDGTCLAQIGTKIKSNQFVWGTMERDGSKVIVHLRLWRRGSTGSEVTARYSATLTEADDDALAKLAVSLLGRLTGEVAASAAGAEPAEDDDVNLDDEPTGELAIYAGDVDGVVVIDGRSYGKIRNGYVKLSVPAGEREVVVRAAGYHEAIADVDVRPRRRADVRLYPERRDRPRRRSEKLETDDSQTGAGIAAIGVGGGLIAGGIYSALRVKSINEDSAFKNYRAQFTQNQNACTEAERGTIVQGQAAPGKIADMCSEARTYEALQYLFFGLGGVAIGTGVLILVTDSVSSEETGPERTDSDQAAVRAKPHVVVGKSGAEVGVQLSF